MSDLIDRQAAIDAIMDELRRVPTNAIRVKSRIEALPSAQPQKVCVAEIKVEIDDIKDYIDKAIDAERWISCSERLPEEDGLYLATCDGEICGEDEPISTMAEFENGKWVDDEDDYQCVLAWMPLPEPYKGE